MQAKQFTDWLSGTFYRHYSLYQAVFAIDQEEDKHEKAVGLETAAKPLATSAAKSLEQVQQEVKPGFASNRAQRIGVQAADKKAQEDLEVYRQKRAEEEAELTSKLLEQDPEAERIVQAIVRKQQAAMNELFNQHYTEIEAKIQELEGEGA